MKYICIILLSIMCINSYSQSKSTEEIETLLDKGDAYIEQSDYRNALLCYEQALEFDDHNSSTLLCMGFTHFKLREFEQAIVYLRQCVFFDKNYSYAWSIMGCTYGCLYTKKGNGKYLDTALFCFRRAIDIEPNDADSWYRMGNVYFDKGNHAESIRCYEKAIVIEPNNADFHEQLGIVYADKKDYAQAKLWFQKSISLNSNNVTAWCEMAVCHVLQNNKTGAIQCFKKALDIDVSKYMAWYFVQIELNKKYKDIPEIEQCFNKALEIGTEELKKKNEEIKKQ
ncbi:MAG: tetratricopeptide repeat protein [Bacteroidales bacterium]|nr:tetratricopeptide repeat protein [Bacteroidales bacterium]